MGAHEVRGRCLCNDARMLADIANGNVDAADVFFLVAFIVALVAVVASLVPAGKAFVLTLLAAVASLLSLAWLLL